MKFDLKSKNNRHLFKTFVKKSSSRALGSLQYYGSLMASTIDAWINS